MHLAQEDDLPAVARDRRVERGPFAVLQEFPRDPSAPEPAAEQEGERRAADVAEEVQREAPPQPEEEPAADGEHAAGKQEHIARGVEQRVKDAAPEFHRADLLLRAQDVIQHGIMPPQPHDEDRCEHEPDELDVKGAPDLGHHAGASISLSAAMCAGPMPQQPPSSRTPRAASACAPVANAVGVSA